MKNHLSLTTEEKRTINLESRIKGWGADLDPAVRPGVPRDKKPELGVESLYPSIKQQIPYVRIHKSPEHGRLTPIFGTTCPPHGLSGWIRDRAYRLSEGRFSHWLLLMFADRVDVVESLFFDLGRGRIPNIYKEMGLSAELKHNRENFTRKAAYVGVGLLAAAAIYSLTRPKKHRQLKLREA